MHNDFPHLQDPAHVRPFVEDDGEWLNLRFDYATIQSSMHKDDPCRLELEYTRAMLLFLLFVPAPRRMLMIGLGGGSLPKYCHRYLPDACIEVVEINPHVIEMRDEFMVPPDSARFCVVEDDGAAYLANAREPYDVILVDGFNFNGPSRQLVTRKFFDDCRAALAPQGVLAVNLDSEDSGDGAVLARLSQSFGGGMVHMLADGGTNRIAYAAAPGLVRQVQLEARERLARLAFVHQATLNRRSGEKEKWPLIDKEFRASPA